MMKSIKVLGKEPISPSFVKRLPPNNKGRDLYVADLHGCYSVLDMLLRRAKFDSSIDRLILGGDMVDRGPDSSNILSLLERPYVHAIRGNHEQMCIESAEYGISLVHLENGGQWLADLGPEDRLKIANRFSALPIAIELELSNGRRIGFVHGECIYSDWNAFIAGLEDDSSPWEQAHLMMQSMVRRTRHETHDQSAVTGIDKIFVGHSGVKEKTQLGNVVYLDTGACFVDGYMTLIDIETEREWVSMPQHRLLPLTYCSSTFDL